MNHDQCKQCFKHNDEVLNYNLDLKVYELKDKFDLSYMGIYEVEDVNMYEEEIKELKIGSLEYYMYKLYDKKSNQKTIHVTGIS